MSEREKEEQDFWHDTLPEILGDLSVGKSDMYMAHALIHAALEPLFTASPPKDVEEHPGLTQGKDGDVWTLCPDCPVWDTPQMDRDHRAMEKLRSETFMGFAWMYNGDLIQDHPDGFGASSQKHLRQDPADAILTNREDTR